MRKPKNYVVAITVVDKEIIEIDSDTDTGTDEVGCRMLALCGEVNASRELANTVAEYGETNNTSMQIVCADDSDSCLVFDLDYKKYLATCSENRNLYLLEDNVRDSSPMLLTYNVDNETSDRSKGKAVENEKSRAGRKAKSPAVSSVSKRLKTEKGRADHKSISRTVFRTKETHQKKGDARQGRKIALNKKTIELKPASDVKYTQKKKEDDRRGRKSSATKNNFNDCKKENEESSAKRNAKPQTIFRASKRLKTENGRADYNSISRTIPVINTKDTQQKKREVLRGRKIPVTKNKVESKSKSHVKDELFHRFKACKKENEKSLSSIDKSYEYYLAYLGNAITIFESEKKVKPVKDLVCLSDPDIIAISNHPFSDGGNFPFEANKDEKVIDVEDGIEADDIFNSLFSKKLMEILRKPYDKKDLLKLSKVASLKRPLTRSRQLRDGREIEYNVENQLTLSFLEQYPDFKKMFHQYEKDCPRALNLLRGFFFYLKNIVLEGAFKPWKHEKRLMNMCFDASGRKAIVPIK